MSSTVILIIFGYLGIAGLFSASINSSRASKNTTIIILLWPLAMFIDLMILGLYIELLLCAKEAEKYGYPVSISIDFDDTLCRKGYPNPYRGRSTWMTLRIAQVCKHFQKKGYVLILNTLREGELLNRAVNWSSTALGLSFDILNENEPKRVEKWGVNPRKIACDLSIDDKSCGLFSLMLRMGF